MRTQFLSTAILLVSAASLLAADLVGQAKVDALMTRRAAIESEVDIAQLNAEIDRAANAKYAHLSGLYWHTDLDEAKKVAAAERKPILTLRLMGRLDEELSCANSRFFRLLLYPDDGVRRLLHERFVLHWQSVRPAAVVTIDLGDGRVLRKTLTGNSVHYVLLPTGEVLDAFPGLFAPQHFRRELQSSADHARELLADPEPLELRHEKVTEYYTAAREGIERRWDEDLVRWRKKARLPKAELDYVGSVPDERSGDIFFRELGAQRPDNTALGPVAEAAVRAEQAAVEAELRADPPENGRGYEPNLNFAFTKNSTESQLLPILQNVRTTMAADTAWNDYVLRHYVHGLFRDGGVCGDLDWLNRQLYSRIDDPWRGLVTPEVFSGLPKGGMIRQGK